MPMNNDAISRSAVLENIYEMDISDCTDVEDIIDKAYAMIAAAPALDVEPVVRGHWIHDINNLYGCSECRARETMSHKKKKNYCNNCGARMDGEE